VHDIRENFNIFCSVVMYPMIPKGMILLRLIPTADHTFEEVDLTIEAFKKIKQSLEEGAYNKELSEVGV